MREAIEKAAGATPFQPFEIILVGGGSLRVEKPEFVYPPPGDSQYFVWTDDGGVPTIYSSAAIEAVRPITSGLPRNWPRQKAG